MTIPFSFIDDGDPNALPVVFLHAFPYCSEMWQGQRAALRDHARFLAFDARGLGTRRADTTAYMLEHAVDDIFALLDHLRISRCVLCGLSMGAWVALRAAARAPERICGLVLANTQPTGDSDVTRLARAEGWRVLQREGVGAFTELQIKRQLSPRSLAKGPELPNRLRAMAAQASPEGIAAALVALATRTDQTDALRGIRANTLVIAGADDLVTPPHLSQIFAENIPEARLQVLPDTGHLANLESEALFNGLLVEHVARLR